MNRCYRGVRWSDGKTMVFCPNGNMLSSWDGFGWGDEEWRTGSEPLAQEIIFHYLRDLERSHNKNRTHYSTDAASKLVQGFLRKYIANLQVDLWILSPAEIGAVITEIETEAAISRSLSNTLFLRK